MSGCRGAGIIGGVDIKELLDGLLSELLTLTGSEYGFIGEVLRRADGTPSLRTHAITNIAWDEATQRFYDHGAPSGMVFENLETLFGAVITSEAPVIANDPAHDPRRGGLPDGHPPLNRFLGLPHISAGELIGMVGLANRPQGYDDEVVSFLEPFVATCANIIAAQRHAAERREREVSLRNLVENAVEGIVVIDQRSVIQSVNLRAAPTEGLIHAAAADSVD